MRFRLIRPNEICICNTVLTFHKVFKQETKFSLLYANLVRVNLISVYRPALFRCFFYIRFVLILDRKNFRETDNKFSRTVKNDR